MTLHYLREIQKPIFQMLNNLLNNYTDVIKKEIQKCAVEYIRCRFEHFYKAFGVKTILSLSTFCVRLFQLSL